MSRRRTLRVADLLQQEVAALLQKEISDPRIGFITITGAEVSADLGVAKIFYSVFGDDTAKEETAKGLKSAYPFIRREVARRLQFKNAPELRFLYDASLDRAERLDQLLGEATPAQSDMNEQGDTGEKGDKGDDDAST